MPAANAISISAAIPSFVVIPSGWFTVGSDTGQDNERPLHRVFVDEFLLAAHQVTNAQYLAFLQATQLASPPFINDPNFNDRDQPVVGVSWFDAVAYCEWLSQREGRRFRLPTEAEWERAARGGVEGRLFPWGDDPPQALPNYAWRWVNGPEPVGRYAPNTYGLYDICENVHEWCNDWFDAEYYAQSPERNPQGPEHGTRKASRGGSWRHHIKVARCAARSSIPPEFKYADYGFRMVCNVR